MTEVIVVRIWPEKPIFLRGSLGSSSKFGNGTRNGIENLRRCCKSVETKSQRILGINSYVCINYRWKADRGAPHSILNKVEGTIKLAETTAAALKNANKNVILKNYLPFS